MIRRRNIIKTVREFDAFPKIPDDYRKQSAVGGTFSIVSVCIIIYLIYAETKYFLDSRLQFKFEPDTDQDNHLQMNIDLTVAMPCSLIGADILDSTNEHSLTTESLNAEDTWWALTPDQRAHFEALKHMNSYFREEYHAIHELLWKSNQLIFSSSKMPQRDYKPDYPFDACRLFGSIDINKVAGNLHVTASKSISLPQGHVHISLHMSDKEYNFTHRINRFSFGKPSPGIIHPLEGDEKISTHHKMMYQYFIEIIPTDIDMLIHKSKTYQYSVRDHERPVSTAKRHELPGIYFKYDISALKVKVSQERDSIGQFLIRLSATVGCIFVTNGILNNLVQKCWYIVCCKFFKKNNETKRYEKLTVDKKMFIKPVTLMNVMTPTSVDNVDILPNSS
ncbi:endoplasmic reticulum-Golgi intermediate compartment protein 2-like isoform X1 [Phymastichus coffea]|uniref:endoplasmic reticulum-Golgi intermediate compartment protein 2-like isoform X1 n=2 Tax=Phymastichus coffea TaxID=108790 RepID=UPI00273B4A6A|nr:endoplasmic reticulum-Golgi intermediate compartment protein 2-like isoform X1 [Phymastichus coffea]